MNEKEGHFWQKENPPPKWERRYRTKDGDWCAAEEYAVISLDRQKQLYVTTNRFTLHEEEISFIEEIISEMKRIRKEEKF